MSLSGIGVEDACMKVFNEMKIVKKADSKDIQRRKMAFFRISDNKDKVIHDDSPIEGKEITRSPEDDRRMFQLMKDSLTEDVPRYILYDFIYNGPDGNRVEKLAFISWCSDNTMITKKMIFAATTDTLKKKFVGLSGYFQVNDVDELNYDELAKKVEKKH